MRALLKSRRGQAALFVTLSLPLTAAMLGLVVDVGWSYYQRQVAQAAADAAALSAAAQVYKAGGTVICNSGIVWCNTTPTTCAVSPTNPPSNSFDTACLYAKQNGFVATAKQNVTITANKGTPPTVSGVSPTYYVTVRISQQLPFTFLSVLRQGNSHTLTARSTAGVFPPWSGGCIYTLDPTDVDMPLNGNTSLDTSCGIYNNSTNSGAITISGSNAYIHATGGSAINIVGGYSEQNSGELSPVPTTGVTPTFDPFQNLVAPPTTSPCVTYSNQNTLSGGTYCNQISTNGGILKLDPGTYILPYGLSVGGNAKIQMSNNVGDGSGGVFLYISGGSISAAGGTDITLSAPTSGTYKGLLMWQPSSNTNASSLSGGSNEQLNGVLYFPTSDLTYNGGSYNSHTNTCVTGTNTTIVSWRLILNGNSCIQAPSVNIPSGLVTAGALLIE
jgi:Flp pilus assembly protein TadG